MLNSAICASIPFHQAANTVTLRKYSQHWNSPVVKELLHMSEEHKFSVEDTRRALYYFGFGVSLETLRLKLKEFDDAKQAKCIRDRQRFGGISTGTVSNFHTEHATKLYWFRSTVV